MTYDPSTTAILLVDPYNDFLGDGGKLWPRVKGIAEEVRLLDHLREVVSKYPPGRVEQITGIPADRLREAAQILGTAKRLVCTVLQGFYQASEATAAYEDWLSHQLEIVPEDLALKHQAMKESIFRFFRATFYRFAQLWPDVCSECAEACTLPGTTRAVAGHARCSNDGR